MVVFKKLFDLMDEDGSGQIDMMEIIHFMLNSQKLKKKQIEAASSSGYVYGRHCRSRHALVDCYGQHCRPVASSY